MLHFSSLYYIDGNIFLFLRGEFSVQSTRSTKTILKRPDDTDYTGVQP